MRTELAERHRVVAAEHDRHGARREQGLEARCDLVGAAERPKPVARVHQSIGRVGQLPGVPHEVPDHVDEKRRSGDPRG